VDDPAPTAASWLPLLARDGMKASEGVLVWLRGDLGDLGSRKGSATMRTSSKSGNISGPRVLITSVTC